MIRSYADADLNGVLDVWHESSGVADSFLPAESIVAERDKSWIAGCDCRDGPVRARWRRRWLFWNSANAVMMAGG